MNEFLFFLSVILIFSTVVLCARLFGREGLIAWAAVAAVLANFLVPKMICVFDIRANMGCILFGSVFLCTDILTEKYGTDAGRRAVFIALIAETAFALTLYLGRLFSPAEGDSAHALMTALFPSALRVTISSTLMFFLSNLADIYLFAYLKKRFPRSLWLRNNVSTILCNCAENFLFIFGAFLGEYAASECLVLSLSCCLLEIIVSLCDTPFVYLGRRYCR